MILCLMMMEMMKEEKVVKDKKKSIIDIKERTNDYDY
jgi:hypothetical protein